MKWMIWLRSWNTRSGKRWRRRHVSRRGVESVQIESLEARTLPTVSFQFDYRYDTNHFFDSSERRAALETAGHLVADQLTDSLSAIQPSGSNRWSPTITNPGNGSLITLPGTTSVAANTILVFAGGFSMNAAGLGGPGGFSVSGTNAWRANVRSRGQSGAISATNPTDTAPWGGSVSFDSVGVNWHFGATTAGLTSTKADFVSLAVHELMHVVGFVNSNKAFTRNINGSGLFTGTNAVNANNHHAVPVDPSHGHWREGQRSSGLETAMDPTIDAGTRKLLTPLDRAALTDMGWTLTTVDDTLFTAPHLLTHFGTTATLRDSASVSTSIESARDVDLQRIYGTAGTTLIVTVTPAVGLDSYLRLFDQSGRELTFANATGINTADTLTFTLPRGDFYYVGISSAAHRDYNPLVLGSGSSGPLGTYQLTVSMIGGLA